MPTSEDHPPESQPRNPQARHVAIEDVDILLAAVTARLRRIAGSQRSASHVASPGFATAEIQAGVLECADALDQLQASWRDEIACRQELEQQLFDACTALAQAPAGLAAPLPTAVPARPRSGG